MKQLFGAFLCLLFLVACSDSNDSNTPEPPPPPPVPPDFAAADAWMQDFVDSEDAFPGGSYIIVDKNLGVVHKKVFGNLTEDSLVLLASTSKVPTVTLLMALSDDDSIDFDIDTPIANYLPWQGVWDENITTKHLVSNRSGIPGLIQVLSNQAAAASHACQFFPIGTLYDCVESLYTNPLPGFVSTPANTAFDYGGSQWQISGGVAESVGGASWNQLWDQYIAQPCDIEITTYGNNLAIAAAWDGNPESLQGNDNPNMEGGMMATLDDYAKLLSLHLSEGVCGDNRVLSAESLIEMRTATTLNEDGSGYYGMGWWFEPANETGTTTVFTDGGAWGSLSWIDAERNYAGVVFFEEYTGTEANKATSGARNQLIPIVAEAFDAVQ
ncbi:MAG: serine hydrolase [Halioglobus sp.]|jgi:CubicO group peptidase (beta-lactamase class C family)|nr:serine hydrolase [Halioglobus sp.]